MKNSTIFKLLSISLLMCPMLNSAMEMPNNAPETMLLSIANQSEQPIDASFLTLQMNQINDFAGSIQPYEDKDNVIPKNGSAVIFTQLGMFTLSPDNVYQPMSLVLSQQVEGHENQNLIVQEIPYHRSNNIVMIVNPNGSISLAQGNAAQAEEKMNAIKQSNYDNVIIDKKPIEILEPSYSSDSSSDEESSIELDPQDMLHQAILNDSAEEIGQAVEAGANINQSRDGKPAILWATLLKKPKAVEALLQCGAQANKDLVQYAVKLHDIKSAVLLAIRIDSIDSGYEGPGSDGQSLTLLSNAILQGDFESAIYLVKNRAAFGQLNLSSGLGNKIMSFIFKRFNISEEEDLVILELLQEMINRGYKIDSIWELKSPSCEKDLSAKIYQAKLLKCLLVNGANPNYIIDMNKPNRVSGGTLTWTPLFKAIEYNNIEAVIMLLDAGADINMQASPRGSFTPIFFAIHMGRVEIVELLLNRGAKI